MTPDQQALRDAWLREMWKPVRELPREEREMARLVWAECAQPVDKAVDNAHRRAS